MNPDKPESQPNEQESRREWDLYGEAIANATVSVKDLIPEINTEDLSLKSPDTKLQENTFTDSVKNRKLKHLPSALGTSFAGKIYVEGRDEKERKSAEQVRAALEEVFRGQTVVDLGTGPKPFGYLIADRAEAKGYVAVEPAFGHELLVEMVDTLNPELRPDRDFRGSSIAVRHELHRIPMAIVEEDMLDFLRRLPDDSVSILCSGMDDIVMPDKKYAQKVAKEIIRVIHPDGGYVGQNYMHIGLSESPEIDRSFVGDENDDRNLYGPVVIYKKSKKKK